MLVTQRRCATSSWSQDFCDYRQLAPELSDPVGSLEVGEHQDVEELGAGSGTERVEALSESALEFIRTHQYLA
jgi:hypothetical protein